MTDNNDDRRHYQHSELQAVLDAGPHPDEDWFRLQVRGVEVSKHLNITREQLVAIRDILAPPTTPTATEAASEPNDLVHDAIARMYEEWERTGGPSPSPSDELRVAAEALGVDPIEDEEALERIARFRERGFDPQFMAAVYVEAFLYSSDDDDPTT